jgi:hypothetical protein
MQNLAGRRTRRTLKILGVCAEGVNQAEIIFGADATEVQEIWAAIISPTQFVQNRQVARLDLSFFVAPPKL